MTFQHQCVQRGQEGQVPLKPGGWLGLNPILLGSDVLSQFLHL